MFGIKEITGDEADEIIEKRKPLGLFYEKSTDLYIGIDNSQGDAFVEEFKTKENCIKWLNGYERDDV